MTAIVVSLLTALTAVGAAASSGQAPAGKSRIGACTILTRDIAVRFAAGAKVPLKDPPTESPFLAGSSCDYGGIELHLDTGAVTERMRTSPQKDWVPVSGVGDTAYFHNVRDVMAEMVVWSGTHHFGILVQVPTGGTAEQMKPAMVQAASRIAPTLK